MEESPDRHARPMPAWERRLRERRKAQTEGHEFERRDRAEADKASAPNIPEALERLRVWLERDPAGIAARLQDERHTTLREALLRLAAELGPPPAR